MAADLAAWTLAAVLVGAAVLKLRDPVGAQAALATYGLRRAGLRRAAWGASIALGLVLALGIALGSAVAADLASALFAGSPPARGDALARAARAQPSGCLGGSVRGSP